MAIPVAGGDLPTGGETILIGPGWSLRKPKIIIYHLYLYLYYNTMYKVLPGRNVLVKHNVYFKI